MKTPMANEKEHKLLSLETAKLFVEQIFRDTVEYDMSMNMTLDRLAMLLVQVARGEELIPPKTTGKT